MADEPRATREGLREQTIIIEDATAELKRLLGSGVFGGTDEAAFVKKADELIAARTKEIADETLRKTAVEALRKFARSEFKRLRVMLTASVVGFSFQALGLVLKIYNGETAEEKAKAFEKLQEVAPQLADEEVVFEPGEAGTWRWGTPVHGYMQDYMKSVNMTAEQLAKDRPKDDGGLSLRLSSEIYVRKRWQDENMAQLREKGVRLVWISSHENCSERCEKWQGRLYSMDGTTGVEDGVKFVPIEEATDRYYTTKAGKTYKNGCLSGFNCRHYTIPYDPNGERPFKMRDDRVEAARAIEQEQRRLERRVYHLREKYYAYKGKNDQRAKGYYKQAAEARKEYIAYCQENEIAWYPSRIRVNP